MNRWLVLLALLGACAIDPLSMQSSELGDPNTTGSGSDGGIVVVLDSGTVHEGGMDSGGSGSSGSGSDGSGSDGSGGGSDGSGSSGSGSDGSGNGSGSAGSDTGSGSAGNGGDDAGLTDINNESDARTNFYACAGCGTSNPSQAGALAFGVILVLRRRRRG
jgi:hypothetical protein